MRRGVAVLVVAATLTVLAVGAAAQSAEPAPAEASPRERLEVSLCAASLDLPLGGESRVAVSVRNTGAATLLVRAESAWFASAPVAVAGAPARWSAAGAGVDSVQLPPGETIEREAVVTAPAALDEGTPTNDTLVLDFPDYRATIPGARNALDFRIRSEDEATPSAAPCTLVELEPAGSRAEATPSPVGAGAVAVQGPAGGVLVLECVEEVAVAPGGVADVEFRVSNREPSTLLVAMNASVTGDASGWSVETLPPGGHLVRAGEEAIFTARVSAPATAEPESPGTPSRRALRVTFPGLEPRDPHAEPAVALRAGSGAVTGREPASPSCHGFEYVQAMGVTALPSEPSPALDPVAVAAASALGLVAVAGAVAARSEDSRYRFLFPLLGLFSRFAKPDVLAHDTRERIVRLVGEEPGIHLVALRDRLGLRTNALVHHLRMLERHEFIVSRREGRHRRFYPAGARLPDASPSPLTPLQERILAAVAARGAVPFADLARELGVSKQRLSYNVKALTERGSARLAQRESDRRWVVERGDAAAPPAERT